MSAPAEPQAGKRSRFEAIDALRGAALVAMFVFHLVWDLGYYRLIPPQWPYAKPFMGYGHLVAGTFLVLVGASLVLATRGGMNWSAFGRRLAQILAGCAAITGATYYLFPESFIFFGILHCIALSSVLALPFLRAPLWLVALVAVVALALPLFVALPALDAPAWWWLGLGTVEPPSNDWRPFLPWFGVVLAGVLLARLILMRSLPAKFAQWRAQNGAGRALVWGGRHSLLVYLVHQPVFIALVFLAARALGPQIATPAMEQDEPFLTSRAEQCVATSGEPEMCHRVCTCIGTQMRANAALWQRVVTDALSPADRDTLNGFSRQCVMRNMN